ncbi:mitotic interactor and substrate of PLK1-like isoform X2 [Scyliorhinus canicula]|uniref:mitotic interactor and substrate of PLK1-like isoform X2 n=1 Tax=Scyliorhinus canicula TaxID=7830 RepID=UPI0018F3C022|nr:mitotic interactor and substrate of PLK1-like isoform X2 [Scyliorhinus canicula]
MLKYTPPWRALCQTIDQRNKKPPTLGIPVEASVVNTVESQPSATVSKDQVHGRLLNSDIQPVEDPESKFVQSKDSEQDPVPSKDTKEIPPGFSNWLDEQKENECVLKEGEEKKSASPEDPHIHTDTAGSLGEMEGTERNDCTNKNGPFVILECSPPNLENGRLSHNPITLIDSESFTSITPKPEINCSNDVIIHAKKVSVIPYSDTGDPDISVNGGSRATIFSEAEQEEGRPPSATLTTIKREANFDLRTYHAEKKPTRLFSDEEEGNQTVTIKGTTDEEMLAKERSQIIRNQAMKKIATIAECGGSAEQVDTEKKLSLVDSTPKEAETQMSGIEANSFPFPNEFSVAHPEGISTEQINFSVARQQFLEMEKSQQEAPRSPRLSAQPYKVLNQSPRLSESSKSLPHKGSSVLDTHPVVALKAVTVHCIPDDEKGNAEEHSTKSENIFIAEKVPTVENGDGEMFVETRRNLAVYSSIDDLDSGLGEMCNDYNYGYTSDGGASSEMLNVGTDNGDTLESSDQKTMFETPIEKEIRLAMEREECLRKERGIRKLGCSEEMVQIKTKPLLSQLPPTSSFSKSKDKNRMVFFVQREIEMDSKREEKLRQEGKVKGLYDKGIPEEVEKRKKVFEQQVDDVPVVPQQSRHPKVASSAPQGPLEVGNIPEQRNTIQMNAAECKVILRESPDYQLFSKSSSKPDPVTRSTATRRAEGQPAHDEGPFTLRPLKCQTTSLIEREIEEEQRREEELRARKPIHSSTRASTPESPNSTFSLKFPGQASRTRASDGDQAKGLPEMVQNQEKHKGKPWERKDDSSYAGIEASDDINIEVMESTRVTRRMSTMAQRWEAGIFNNNLDE